MRILVSLQLTSCVGEGIPRRKCVNCTCSLKVLYTAVSAFNPSHYHTIRRIRSTFGGGKYSHWDRKSSCSCQNTEGWKSFTFPWNLSWNTQSLESIVTGLTRVCQVAWYVTEGQRKIGKPGWPSTYTRSKGDRGEYTNYHGISLLRLPGKVYAKCLEKRCHEIIERELNDTRCSFCPGRSTKHQIFTLQQILEKSMPKTLAHVLSTSRNQTTVFLVKNFGKCYGNKVLTAACCWLRSHFISAQKFVSLE